MNCWKCWTCIAVLRQNLMYRSPIFPASQLSPGDCSAGQQASGHTKCHKALIPSVGLFTYEKWSDLYISFHKNEHSFHIVYPKITFLSREFHFSCIERMHHLASLCSLCERIFIRVQWTFMVLASPAWAKDKNRLSSVKTSFIYC